MHTTMRELTLQLPNLRIGAIECGNPEAPRLLALHGWLDNAASFSALAPHLCEHFHFVALDLPGHGRSDHAPAGMGYRFADGIFDVLAAADALGWESFDLLGHSMGAGIASLTAAACPGRIRRLVAIEALGALTTPPEQTLVQLRRALTQALDLVGKPLRVFATADEAIAARMKASGLSRDAATAIVLRGIRPVPGGFSWSSDPRLTLASPQRFTEPQVLALLRGIEARTLLILAPDSQVKPVSEEAIAARVAEVPAIEVRELSGGHHLHLENPLPVANAILEFLQSVG
jgi:pimeloyl-ACP methyl ester carboxylesterase